LTTSSMSEVGPSGSKRDGNFDSAIQAGRRPSGGPGDVTGSTRPTSCFDMCFGFIGGGGSCPPRPTSPPEATRSGSVRSIRERGNSRLREKPRVQATADHAQQQIEEHHGVSSANSEDSDQTGVSVSRDSLFAGRHTAGAANGEAAKTVRRGSPLSVSNVSVVLPPYGPGVRPEVSGLQGPFSLRGAGDDLLEPRPRDPVSEQRSGVVADDAQAIGYGAQSVGAYGSAVRQSHETNNGFFFCESGTERGGQAAHTSAGEGRDCGPRLRLEFFCTLRM